LFVEQDLIREICSFLLSLIFVPGSRSIRPFPNASPSELCNWRGIAASLLEWNPLSGRGLQKSPAAAFCRKSKFGAATLGETT
jgi:hypothetical protein